MPFPDVCKFGCYDGKTKRAPWLNGPQCVSVEEKYEDSNIPAPTPQPYLGGFSYSQSSGPPFCNPVWYAYRYVRNSDGGYGPLSNWTGYDPKNPNAIPKGISSGATADTLPCLPQGCSESGVPTGSQTCWFNVPEIVLIDKLNMDIKNGTPDGYTLNVHRQEGFIDQNAKPPVVKGFDPKSEGTVVGSFLAFEKPSTSNKVTAMFYDNIFNPKSTSSNTCC